MCRSRGRRTFAGRISTAAGVFSLVATVTVALAGCHGQAVGASAPRAPGVAAESVSRADLSSGRHSVTDSAPASRAGRASGASSTAGVNSPSGVTGGALFGANYPVVALQPNLGRKLAIVRLYYFVGDSFPGKAKFQNLLARGQTVLVSIDATTSYASIAAGQKDAEINSFLQQVNQAAIKYNLGSIYISFEHEPDSMHHRALGAPVQFLQAWDHVHQLAENAGLDWNQGGRLHWVLILIHDSYAKSWRVGSFWPGSSEVDIVAADGYNSFGCGSGGQTQQQTPADTFGPIVSFAAAHGGMPVFLAEWGSDDIPAGTQATYINQMQSFVANNNSIAGAMYWDTHVGNCDYTVDGNAASISALAAMGRSAALQGHV
jgi:hypothetical protein